MDKSSDKSAITTRTTPSATVSNPVLMAFKTPGPNLFLMDIYGKLGYNISWFGAVLGAIYAFIDGFILAALFAWFYNRRL